MPKFKIVKKPTELVRTEKYFIYHKKRFLWWTWWEKLTVYTDKWNKQKFVMAFDTLEEAKSHLDRLKQGIIIEIDEENE